MLCCRERADGLESAVAAERNERRVSAARDAGVERVRRVRYASSCNCKLSLRNPCRGAPVAGLLFAAAAGWNERRVSAARDKGVERVRCEPKGARPEGFQRYHAGFKHALQRTSSLHLEEGLGSMHAAAAAERNERRVSAAIDKGVERVCCEPKERDHIDFKAAPRKALTACILR